ncbi:MAG: (2Fe-2S)-binding protein [Kiritimatiellales bacterium]|nr:(2Fe-2S)-binding protein [Kiritimatiellales bacterium]
MPKITFTYDGKKIDVEAKEGESLLEAALREGIPMEHACGGNGFCTTCRCKVNKGSENLSPRNDREENMGITEDSDRLGCQAQIHGDCEIELAED